MTDTDGSSKPPQISEMFQKFALAFKSKTFEFFADIEAVEDSDGFYVLESADEVITDQKVVVIKPDPIDGTPLPTLPSPAPPQSVIARPWSSNRTQLGKKFFFFLIYNPDRIPGHPGYPGPGSGV